MRFTTEWLAARLAKNATNLQAASGNCEKESDLHRSISDYCKQKGWIALHGSMAHRSHRTIGEPDFIIIADLGRVFFLEAKRKGSKPTPEQSALIAWIKKLGGRASVVYSLEEAISEFDKP